MPELPAHKRARFTAEFGLREYDAEVLTATRASSEYFETAARVSGDPKTAANWVMGDLMGLLKAEGKEIAESPVSAENLGELVKRDRRRGDLRQARQGDLPEDVHHRGAGCCHYGDAKG